MKTGLVGRMGRVCAAALVVGFIHHVGSVAAQTEPDPVALVRAEGRRLVRDGVTYTVRGMNYFPGNYAWKFWQNYGDSTLSAQIDTELDQARALGVNTVRFFLPYALFRPHPRVVIHTLNLKDFVRRLKQRQMLAIVTLFDFYPADSRKPYAPSDYAASFAHIETVVKALGKDNTTVLAWDLKNELDRDYHQFTPKRVKAWARQMLRRLRNLDPNHLITLGFYGAVSGAYDPGVAAEFAADVDVVSMHYFLPEGTFSSDLQKLLLQVGGKPVLLEEFGLHTLAVPSFPCNGQPQPSCDDPHTEIEQAAYYNALLSLSESQNLAGILFWTLMDFSYILPDMQESHHCQGVLRNSQVTVCEVTGADYSEKPAAMRVGHHFEPEVAYLDDFDGWVDSRTDAPPLDWTDSWAEGGVLFRGYGPDRLLWSHTLGTVAIAKFVQDDVSYTGTAASPTLNVDIDRFPLIVGKVSNYEVRDSTFGSDCVLHVGVRESAQVTPLYKIEPGTSMPQVFSIDMREAPTEWHGVHSFQVVLQLQPIAPNNGYSATYELDWIGVQAPPP